jgi:tripartite-type tricarboxylate transporter receptor subunit TctC
LRKLGASAAGKLRPLAVIGKTRSPVLPDVPCFVELGFPRLDLRIHPVKAALRM